MIDILVKWTDGTINVVSSNDIETLEENSVLSAGVGVKMYWPLEKKYYFGTVIEIEGEMENEESEDYSVPLSTVKIALEKNETKLPVVQVRASCKAPLDKLQEDSDSDIFSDTDNDPTYKQACEFRNCTKEIFAACEHCQALLCWKHFNNNKDCQKHGDSSSEEEEQELSHVHSTLPLPTLQTAASEKLQITNDIIPAVPSLSTIYALDGEQREVPLEKKKKENKRKIAHAHRSEGKAYISAVSGKAMPAKLMKPHCSGHKYKSNECTLISDEQRQKIFNAYYHTKSLQLQREFIVRHVQAGIIKRRRTTNKDSRRTKTLHYYLPKKNGLMTVCKTMFLNTLGISEKTMRTALSKKTEEGVLLPDKRGGRYKHLKLKDDAMRASVQAHIQKFPKMESHYCRKSTSREYLHPDLTVQKMYHLYILERAEQPKCSYHTYRRVFKSLNLSFHHPKKDQCTLCLSYREGDAEKKSELHDVYIAHTAEKTTVRHKKEEAKEISKKHPDKVASVVFDLQQVIQLPISNESALFYRRRLSTFNFTVYNIGNKDCYCFLWYEAISKRGSSEISTCVAKYLNELDNQGIQEVRLFADGCSGQNRNTIVFTMLLCILTNAKNIKKISLCFFEKNHGQSEGDSAHSSISTALSLAGDVFIPAQLPPILRLARQALPYTVITMNIEDFYNFKLVSEQIRIRSVRKFDSGEDVDWTKVKEVMVNKDDVTKLSVKNSHLADEYYKLSLKRNTLGVMNQPLPKLNTTATKITAEKYKDLVELCTGHTPIVRNTTFQQFFKDLPHY